jgi:hypothetical protein
MSTLFYLHPDALVTSGCELRRDHFTSKLQLGHRKNPHEFEPPPPHNGSLNGVLAYITVIAHCFLRKR